VLRISEFLSPQTLFYFNALKTESKSNFLTNIPVSE